MSPSISEALATIKPGTVFVGIDLGRRRNTAVAITAQARRVGRCVFSHDAEGYENLTHHLQRWVEERQAPQAIVGMEPTNYYWKLLGQHMERTAQRYVLINPYTVKKHREGDQLDRAKDDQRDAFTIADLVRTGKFTQTRLLHGTYASLRAYAALYAQTRRQIARQKNQLRSRMDPLFPELQGLFRELGYTAQAIARHHAAAVQIRHMSWDQFLAAVQVDAHGHRLQLGKVRQVYELAPHSVGVSEGLDALQFGVTTSLERLALLEQQQDQEREVMTEALLRLPEAAYVLSVPGIGLVSAALLLGEIGDPSRYRNAQQLVKLAGIQPSPNASGERTHSPTAISRKGRALLRETLYFCCLRLIQRDEAFIYHYDRYQQRSSNPLTKTQALGALMNKLLRILWALIKQQTYYDPTKALAR